MGDNFGYIGIEHINTVKMMIDAQKRAKVPPKAYVSQEVKDALVKEGYDESYFITEKPFLVDEIAELKKELGVE